MKTELQKNADQITNIIKRASRRWHTHPKNVLHLRTSNSKHQAYQARRDVILELYELGYPIQEIASIFKYKSPFPIYNSIHNFKFTRTNK